MTPAALALVAAAVLATPAQDRDFTVGGIGALPCSVAIEGYGEPDFHARIENLVAVSWAQGFVSALNLAELPATKAYADLGSMSAPEQLQALGAWCRENPDEMFFRAAMHLRTRLRRPSASSP